MYQPSHNSWCKHVLIALALESIAAPYLAGFGLTSPVATTGPAFPSSSRACCMADPWASALFMALSTLLMRSNRSAIPLRPFSADPGSKCFGTFPLLG